jgi:hypothetical protein
MRLAARCARARQPLISCDSSTSKLDMWFMSNFPGSGAQSRNMYSDGASVWNADLSLVVEK